MSVQWENTSILLSSSEIESLRKEAVCEALLEIIVEVTESAKQEDSPIYRGDEEVDYFVKLSDVTDAINKHLNK